MHGISVHSALAIKRQRKRRDEQKRSKDRRYSADHRPSLTGSEMAKPALANKMMGTITMFHVGTIFLVIGLFLLTGALVPNETKKDNMGDLIGTGVICIIIGIFLIILNRIYGIKEEDELTTYVESRLARTKSGQRLYHDSESVPEHLNAHSPSVTNATKHGSGKKKRAKNKHDKIETVNEVSLSVNGGKVNQGAAVDDISPSSIALERITEESLENDRERSYRYEDPRTHNLYRVYDRDYLPGGQGPI